MKFSLCIHLDTYRELFQKTMFLQRTELGFQCANLQSDLVFNIGMVYLPFFTVFFSGMIADIELRLISLKSLLVLTMIHTLQKN